MQLQHKPNLLQTAKLGKNEPMQFIHKNCAALLWFHWSVYNFFYSFSVWENERKRHETHTMIQRTTERATFKSLDRKWTITLNCTERNILGRKSPGTDPCSMRIRFFCSFFCKWPNFVHLLLPNESTIDFFNTNHFYNYYYRSQSQFIHNCTRTCCRLTKYGEWTNDATEYGGNSNLRRPSDTETQETISTAIDIRIK